MTSEVDDAPLPEFEPEDEIAEHEANFNYETTIGLVGTWIALFENEAWYVLFCIYAWPIFNKFLMK